ncbi:hypothetical protein WG66_012140, partial [Moniliophthora roreri]
MKLRKRFCSASYPICSPSHHRPVDVSGFFFAQRVRERIGLKGNTLVLAVHTLRSRCPFPQPLLKNGCIDQRREVKGHARGRWRLGRCVVLQVRCVLIANRGFTTALGVNALRGYIEEPKGKEYKKLERDRVTVVKPELVYSHMSSAPPSSVTQGM